MSNTASFYKGRKAFFKPEKLKDGHTVPASNPFNPFREFENHREWDRGFNDSFDTNLKKVKVRERRSRKLGDKLE